jgi:hypothetical protein
VGGLGSADNGGIGDEREMNTGVGDQVSLELVEIDVQRAVEAQRGGDGRDDCGLSAGDRRRKMIKTYPER